MKKQVLFEFEDLAWFPGTIRESMTDYLRYFLTATNFYQPITPLITEGLAKTSQNRIVDLCSGSGGAIHRIYRNLNTTHGNNIEITLTDKFPNVPAYRLLSAKTNGKINFSDSSIDATNVPVEITGFRTIFSGIHHFTPETAKSVIRNAVQQQEGIGIFDGGDKNLFTILGIILFHPVAFLLLTPFFRPFRLSRLIFTYLVPIIPFCTVWDGVISILRLYKPEELLTIAKSVKADNYVWKAGKAKNRFGMNIAYLIGYPETKTI